MCCEYRRGVESTNVFSVPMTCNFENLSINFTIADFERN